MIKNKKPIVINLNNRCPISHNHLEYYRQVVKSVLSIYDELKSNKEFRNSEGSIEFGLEGLFLGMHVDTIIELKYEEKSLDFGEIFCIAISKKKSKIRKYMFTFDKGDNFIQMTNLGIKPDVCYVYNYIIERHPHETGNS